MSDSQPVFGFAGPMDVSAFGQFVDGGSSLRPGYTFTFTTDLALAMLRAGARLALFACDEAISDPQVWHGDQLTVHVVPRRPDYQARGRDLFAAERRQLSVAMMSESLAAINAHWTYEFALAALDSGTPSLITIHDWAPKILRHNPDRYRIARLRMQRQVMRRGDHFTAPSPYIAKLAAGRTPTPVEVIANGLALPEILNRPAPPTYCYGALNSGWDRRKNVTTLLKAFAQVRSSVPEARLRLAGRGYEVDGPAYLWARSNLQSLAGIEFLGELGRSQVKDFMSSIALFVHPSLEESFGMVLVEALAAGTEVLGGVKSGAVPWVVGSDAVTDISDPARLADQLLRRGANPQLVARSRVERFDIDRVAKQYLDQLLRLVR